MANSSNTEPQLVYDNIPIKNRNDWKTVIERILNYNKKWCSADNEICVHRINDLALFLNSLYDNITKSSSETPFDKQFIKQTIVPNFVKLIHSLEPYKKISKYTQKIIQIEQILQAILTKLIYPQQIHRGGDRYYKKYLKYKQKYIQLKNQ